MTRTRAVLLAAALSAVFAGRSPAQDAPKTHSSWTTTHLALAGAFGVALEIDAAQTREAMRRGFRETNPLLGQHPTAGRVNTYTAVAGLAVLGVAAVVPARLRPWVLGFALAVETVTVAGAVREGIAIQFP